MASRWKRMALVIALTPLAGYLGFCLILLCFQRSFIYFPTEATRHRPGEMSTLTVQGASLRISERRLEGPNALIYFGGNAEDVSFSLPLLSKAYPNHALYLLHYRGYGGSTGQPTEEALHADARALFEMVHARHEHVLVMGRSLGTAVAVRLAATQPVNRLVLVTPYDSILHVAQLEFPYVPVSLILRDKFESCRDAPKVQAPTLILAAEGDEVIPRESTQALFRTFSPGVARMQYIPRSGHNSISARPEYLKALQGLSE